VGTPTWVFPRRECWSIVYCEYSTGSEIDRKNQRMREVERVADWIFILFTWLIAMPNRAARILETGWTVVAEMAIARLDWRRFAYGSPARAVFVRAVLAQSWPLLRSIRWVTYCLGRGWTSAPPGLLPALVSSRPGRSVHRLVGNGVPGFIASDHFLSCSGCVPGYEAPTLGALGHLSDFSLPAYAADF
jgi:hypothetical protein